MTKLAMRRREELSLTLSIVDSSKVVGSLAAETAGDLKSLLKELVDELAFQEGSRLTLLGQNRKLQGDIDRAKNDAARAVVSRPALQRKKERKKANWPATQNRDLAFRGPF